MKILFIGQLPPPYNGQNLQIERIIGVLNRFNYNYKFIQLDFSTDTRNIGVVGLGKIFTLFKVFFKIVSACIFYKPDYVHYPPAGPKIVPMFRDFFLLFPIRFLRFPVIFRFHAGGISTLYDNLSFLNKIIFKYIYFHPEYGTCMSNAGKFDSKFINAKNIVVIPNGVEDSGFDPTSKPSFKSSFIVLFIGLCIPSKGILHFLEAIELARKHIPYLKGRIIGEVLDSDVNDRINQAVERGIVSFEGVCTGYRKNELINQSHLLLFPTFYPSENFPTVILEAFSYGLPVISTRWRGVVDQIEDGRNGLIHEVGAVIEMADSLVKIANNEKMYLSLCNNARKSYLKNYTIERFENNFVNFFNDLSSHKSSNLS